MQFEPIQSTGLVDSITEKNSLIAFQLFVVIGLIAVCKTLWGRITLQGDSQSKSFTDSIVALNNNTLSTNALISEVKDLRDKIDDLSRALERASK